MSWRLQTAAVAGVKSSSLSQEGAPSLLCPKFRESFNPAMAHAGFNLEVSYQKRRNLGLVVGEGGEPEGKGEGEKDGRKAPSEKFDPKN